MLTLKAPIEIKARTTYLADRDAFYARITGNYSLMENRLDSEDLLHLSVTPPEIYVQEGSGLTSILNSNQSNETNIQKVEILNNVLNRIVMSADAHLSYQDRVFITDTLYKLGIRDDRRFMKAFYRIAEETRNTNTLINLYLERGEELSDIIESMEASSGTEREIVTEETTRERENYLYERITDRLRTGAIYQIVSNFNRSVEENEIDSREYSIAGQTYMAQHMLLSILRQQTGITDASMIYLNDNTYEESLEQSDTQISNVRNEMTAAVMMDMLKNIYHTGFDRFYLHDNRLYRFEDVFYGSSNNTLNRLSQYQGDVSLTMRVNESLVDESTSLMNSEINLLEGGEGTGEISEEELVNITRQVNEINIRNEQRRQQYMQILQQVREKVISEDSSDRMAKTRRDGLLALNNPEELIERLGEEEEVRQAREKELIREITSVLPGDAAQIFEIINEYQENPRVLIENNIVRRDAEGELIYDIHEIERAAAAEASDNAARAVRQAQELRESLEKGSREAAQPAVETISEYEAAPIVHRRTQSLTEEELEEQLSVVMSDLSRQINTVNRTETVTEHNTVTNSQIVNHETMTQTLNEREIRQMISDGVKSQMQTISNQVFRRMENQMHNEKARRGY